MERTATALRSRRWGSLAAGSVCLLVSAVALACRGDADPGPDGAGARSAPAAALAPLRVTVTAPALGWLVARLGGDSVEVAELGAEALDAGFAPTARQVLSMSEADLIVARGHRVEPWLETVSLPESRLVETVDVLGADDLVEREGPTHSHGPEGEHSHRMVEPGTQLAPALFAQQAEAVARALGRVAESTGRSDLADAVAVGSAGLEAELAALGKRLIALGASAREAGLTTCSAPAGGAVYMCRALGLPIRELGGSAGSGRQREGRELVLWPLGTPDPPMSVEATVVPIDLVERRAADPATEGFGYLERQRGNVERLELAFGARAR